MAEDMEKLQEQLRRAKQGQKDLRELRGYPGHKKAMGASADEIHKIQKRIAKTQKRQGRGR